MTDASLSTLELLQRVIGIREAKRLYAGALAPLFKMPGDGTAAHEKLLAARELVKRYLEEDLKRDCVLKSPVQTREYLRVLFAGLEHEQFVGLFLANHHRVIAAEELARGTIDGAAVYPREVVKRALHLAAAAVIFSHNHPSGVAEPSAADRALTERLKVALGTVDVRVLDHFVVGATNVISFAERGWI